MSQNDILNYMKKVNRPIIKKEVFNMGMSERAIDLNFSRLQKNNLIKPICTPKKKNWSYFLK